MQCPTCRIGLVMTEKQGIEIDYCPQCWGIWLDRGELHKFIEKSYYSPAEVLHRIPPPYGHPAKSGTMALSITRKARENRFLQSYLIE